MLTFMLMSAMLQDLLEKQERELHNYLDFMEKLILLVQHWASQWVELQEVSLLHPNKLLIFLETELEHIFSQILLLHPLLVHHLKLINCLNKVLILLKN